MVFKKGQPQINTSPTQFKKRCVPWNKGKKFPERCRENHHNWKGGRVKDQYGYIKIKFADHPLSDTQGYILEHRLVMEKVLGRYLNKSEQVHHLNGIRDDNKPENLVVVKLHNHERHTLEKLQAKRIRELEFIIKERI